MEEIFNNLLEKPLAFLITIFGILFLGLSGLTKLFQIEIDKKNSSRLFIAGMALIIAGIPIYYFVENKDSTKLSVELINISYYENDSGHNCSGSSNIHIRETFKINNTKDEKLFKIILNSKTPIAREILYKDSNSNYAFNYCVSPNIEKNISILIISNSGKASEKINYKINTLDLKQIKQNATSLSRY